MPTEVERLAGLLADDGLHTSAELGAAGVSRTAVARAVRSGAAVQYGRGLYCTAAALGANGIGHAAMTLNNPGVVVCMLSAAQWHDLSDEDPAESWLAVDRTACRASVAGLPHVPVRTVWWQPGHMRHGIETVTMAGVPVRVTDPARTVVDLVRNRGKIGDETAMKALHDYVRSGRPVADIWERASEIGARVVLEPFFRAAEEFSESVPVRGF